MRTILTIAGFDPSSGAGVTADLAVISRFGFFGTSCITALTVQSTLGVRSVHPVEAAIVRETLDELQRDLPAAAIKIGMLGSAEMVAVVAGFLKACRQEGTVVVLDPVLRSSSGAKLLSDAGLDAMRDTLLPLVEWITPNLMELEVLSGAPVRDADEMVAAALSLQALLPTLGVVATGGHLRKSCDDLVVRPGGQVDWLRGAHIETSSTHGTGCAFSTSMTCGLASGRSALQAAATAKAFVASAMELAVPLGGGKGPLNLASGRIVVD